MLVAMHDDIENMYILKLMDLSEHTTGNVVLYLEKRKDKPNASHHYIYLSNPFLAKN